MSEYLYTDALIKSDDTYATLYKLLHLFIVSSIVLKRNTSYGLVGNYVSMVIACFASCMKHKSCFVVSILVKNSHPQDDDMKL